MSEVLFPDGNGSSDNIDSYDVHSCECRTDPSYEHKDPDRNPWRASAVGGNILTVFFLQQRRSLYRKRGIRRQKGMYKQILCSLQTSGRTVLHSSICGFRALSGNGFSGLSFVVFFKPASGSV